MSTPDPAPAPAKKADYNALPPTTASRPTASATVLTAEYVPRKGRAWSVLSNADPRGMDFTGTSQRSSGFGRGTSNMASIMAAQVPAILNAAYLGGNPIK